MSKKTPLIVLIENTVDQKLASAGAGLTREDVIEIVNDLLDLPTLAAESAGARGDRPTCPRSPHKGKHGQKCRDAGYVG